jgi:hypothetical protein
VVFSTKPVTGHASPLKPGVRLVINTPDGRQLGGYPLFDPAQFSAVRAQCDVKIGHNWVRGDLHRYELHVEDAGLAVDLVFTGTVPAWRPGAGITYYDEELTRFFAWLPAFPYGKVEGTLTYEGKLHKVSGTGYHDHNWGNVGLEEVMSGWYWGRAHVGNYTLIFAEMASTRDYDGQKIPIFMLARHDKILTGDGAPLVLEAREFVKHPGGRRYPRKVDFCWKSSLGEVNIALRRPQLLEASSLLGLAPPWQQRLLRLFANPYYFRFNTDLKLRLDFAGEKCSEKGTALFELMLLK